MKKIFVLLLVLLVSITLMAGCGGGDNTQAPAPDATEDAAEGTKEDTSGGDSEQTYTPDAAAGSTADMQGGGVTTNITANEARAILQSWVDSHPFQLGAQINPDEALPLGEKQGEDYSNECYRFYLGITRLGVAEILVHKETGALFHLDSPYSSVGFVPIDDWYNKDHAGYAPALSANDARAVYNTWLGNHAGMSEYTLSLNYAIYEDGAYYYWFFAENPEWYWYNILVDMETGGLLFMMTPDGEDTTPTIEPMDDYYNRYY